MVDYTKPSKQGVKKERVVTINELPLCCPTSDMPLWSAHPRVFLPLKEEKRVTCPYCSAVYVLKD